MTEERLEDMLKRLIVEYKPPFRYTPLGRGLIGLGAAGLLGLGVLGVGHVKVNVDVGGGMSAAWEALVTYDNNLKQERANTAKAVGTGANYALTAAGKAASDAWRTLIIYDGYLKQERVNWEKEVESGANYVLASSWQAAADAWSNANGFIRGLSPPPWLVQHKNDGNIEYLGSEPWLEDDGTTTTVSEPEMFQYAMRIANTNGLGACLRTEPDEKSKTRMCWREGTQVTVVGEEIDGYLPISEPADGYMPKRFLILPPDDLSSRLIPPARRIDRNQYTGPATAAHQEGQSLYQAGQVPGQIPGQITIRGKR